MRSVGIIGLGYVGLPLAVAMAGHYEVVGFDINPERVNQLSAGHDTTHECSKGAILGAKSLSFTTDERELQDVNTYIITVPTPINSAKQPDLTYVINASKTVAKVLKNRDLVIYESTVYPGVTEDICSPILSKVSGLVLNKNFFLGYSPERINPGDKNRSLKDIVKVTSGSNEWAANEVDLLYKKIVNAGTWKAPSIKVAEAAKVIENTQRDVNIALINEFSLIFEKMGIDTMDVLQAAGTKWNFLDFRPGLVGGHCIGVDPYYLTHIAQELDYHPEVILSGRRINDNFPKQIATRFVKVLSQRDNNKGSQNILILGFTFKEDCPDTRNTKVYDLIQELTNFGKNVHVYDPHVQAETKQDYKNLDFVSLDKANFYDGIILAVAHQEFKDLGINKLRHLGRPGHIFFDLKGLFSKSDVDLRV